MLIFTRYSLMVLNGLEGIQSLGLGGLIQPVLGAASCDDHPLLIPARLCPARCHILHPPLLPHRTLLRAAPTPFPNLAVPLYTICK